MSRTYRDWSRHGGCREGRDRGCGKCFLCKSWKFEKKRSKRLKHSEQKRLS